MKQHLVRYVGPLLAIGVFTMALAVLHDLLTGERVADVLRHLRAFPTHRVALAGLFTVASFVVLSGYDALALRYVRKTIPYRRTALASFLNYAFAQGLGFPLITGGSVRFRLYSRWGLSAIHITNIIAFASVTFWLGVVMLAGFVLLSAPSELTRVLPLPREAVRPAGVALLAMVAMYLTWSVTGRAVVRVRGWAFRRPHLRLVLVQMAIATVDWLVAAAVLYVLLPPDAGVGYPAFVGIFLLAFVAGVVSHVPAGLGVFETVVLLLLPDGAPDAAVLGSLIVYRGVYYLLPLLAAALTLAVHELIAWRAGLARLAGTLGRVVPTLAPNILAFTTFVGGVTLLVSGATPRVTTGARWAYDSIPLPLIELSHFLASLAGLGLCVVAAGLQRRLDIAYRLTAILLGAGIGLSLLKGLDYQEAILLAILLAVLVPARRQFYRTASLLGEPLTPGWVAAILLVVIGTSWLGFFAHPDLDYSADVWRHVARGADGPRFLRTMAGVTIAAIIVALVRLLRPPRPAPTLPDDVQLDRAHAIAASSGDTLGHAALIGDKALLFAESGRAFLMFAVEGRSWVALGDPVGPSDEHAELAWRFRELADRHGGWTVFYLASRSHLAICVELGLSLVKIGEEARIDLARPDPPAPAADGPRRAHRRLREDGLDLEIVSPEGVGGRIADLRAVSDAWVGAGQTGEKGFAQGRFAPDYLRRLPCAFVRQGGRLIAFATLWPGAPGTELSVDLVRFVPEAPAGTIDFVLVELLHWGRRAGYRWLNLGMAPLAGLEGRTLTPLWGRVGALAFRWGEHFDDIHALRAYKDQFAPEWEPRYIASPSGIVLPRVVANIATLISRGSGGVVAP